MVWETDTISAAPKTPDWKVVKKGVVEVPSVLIGHEKLWAKILKRFKLRPTTKVEQKDAIIGGNIRWRRPIWSYKLIGAQGTLTFTTDRIEAQAWNRLKGKRNAFTPAVKDVVDLTLSGGKKLWVIRHENLAYPPPKDWHLFIDTFFRWRAMAKDALKPAKPEDLQEFLEWLLIPEKADAKAQNRRRQDQVVPFAMKKKRDAKIDRVRAKVWKDPRLEEKIRWAKQALRFLKAHNVKHRDLDPSNLGKTARGKVVVTNIAESRSKGKKPGRLGRLKASVKYEHINFKPPEGAANAAKRGLELRKKNGGKGGTTVGVARARDLSARKNMSPDTVRRMKAFFDRHQKNKKASGGKKQSEDKGYIAWMLWGGDAGYSWAKKVVKQMEAADKKVKASMESGSEVSAAYTPFLRTAQAIHALLNPEAEPLESTALLSGSGRRTYGLIHLDDDMRSAVLSAGGGKKASPKSLKKGLAKLEILASRHGEKMARVHRAVLESTQKTKVNAMTDSTKVEAYGYRKPVDRKAAARKAAQTKRLKQIPIDVTINGKTVKAYVTKDPNGEISWDFIQFRSAKSLMKLANLKMTQNYSYTDDYKYDSDTNFGKGNVTTLGDLIKEGKPHGLWLRMEGRKGREELVWLVHRNNRWSNGEPLRISIKKTAKPDPIDFGEMAAATTPDDICGQVAVLLDKDHEVGASAPFTQSRILLARYLTNNEDARLAAYLAANKVPVSAIGAKLQKRVLAGLEDMSMALYELGPEADDLFLAVSSALAADLAVDIVAPNKGDKVSARLGSNKTGSKAITEWMSATLSEVQRAVPRDLQLDKKANFVGKASNGLLAYTAGEGTNRSDFPVSWRVSLSFNPNQKFDKAFLLILSAEGGMTGPSEKKLYLPLDTTDTEILSGIEGWAKDLLG